MTFAKQSEISNHREDVDVEESRRVFQKTSSTNTFPYRCGSQLHPRRPFARRNGLRWNARTSKGRLCPPTSYMSSSRDGKPVAQKRLRDEPPILKNQLLIFGALLTFRILNSSFVQTSFQPDEYFQSLEPAWDIAFGPHSGAWLTWVRTQDESRERPWFKKSVERLSKANQRHFAGMAFSPADIRSPISFCYNIHPHR